jgi:hypothetical protein
VLLAAASLAVGCGEDSRSSADAQASPSEAIAEIGKTRAGLDDALSAYRSGDRAAAETKVGDAYLEHFEHVEAPLGRIDERLNEQLEEALSVDLRNKIKAGAPAHEVEALAKTIRVNLRRAEIALK